VADGSKHDTRKFIVRRVEDTKPETRGEIEKRIFFSPGEGSDHVRFTMYRAKPGLESDLHTNPGDDASYIIQGELILEAEGRTYNLKAGDAFILRQGVAHKAKVVGKEDLILLASHCEFCPLFQDWNRKQAKPQPMIQ
jgi:quercetin dioxygenase-like cupin family protein